MEIIKLISPLEVMVSNKKKFILNMNNYRNAHYQVLNKAKVAYKMAMVKQITRLAPMDVVKIKYRLYPKTRRKMDISNILAIHDKFFCDALVELGGLPDDDYRHVVGSNYRFGGVDSGNGRVEILIKNLVPS